jgi:glutamine amidotransferase
MRGLRGRGFDELLRERVAAGALLLGVCVGMQMLFEASEEFGETAGLGFVRGRVRRFPASLRVPHVGWNAVRQRGAGEMWRGVADGEYFYFVHSYFCDGAAAGVTEYDGTVFTSAVVQGNIWGVQFHPEKSQAAGLRLLKNFAETSPC